MKESYARPQWMYADPALTIERLDARPKLVMAEVRSKPRRNYGLVSAGTLRLIKRMRIQELMKFQNRRT